MTLGTTLTATGTITDGDMATVSISAGAAATEGSPVTFTVNLSTAAAEAVNLNWTGAGGTATAGTDYTAAGTVTIPANMTTATFTVATVDDALVEGDETFTVTLAASGTLPDGVTLGGAMAIGTITDDDSATVSIVGVANANEGSPVIFTVNLSAEASSDVVLNWSAAAGTAALSDIGVANGTARISAGMTTGMITVATVEDTLAEDDETFTVTITENTLPVGVSIGANMATGTINDNDSATVSVANASAGEGEAVEFTVSLSAQASSDVVLNWSTTDGTAMAPGDYTPMSSGTVTIAAGATTNTFTVATADDALVEGDETFTVTLAASGTLPDGVTLGGAMATGTITDDDSATVSIAGAANATEGSSVTFTVNLTAQASSDVVLNWSTTDGTAMAPGDYTPMSSGTVTIAAGATTNTFTVATADDALVEGDETFTVTITENTLPASVSIGTTTATGTITDGDMATVSVAGDAAATEGSPVTFRVNLNTAAAEAVNLSWTGAGGTATASTDYTAVGTVTIAAGATTNTFTVATVDDALVEGDETFTVTLAASGALPTGVTLGTTLTATGTITDGDMATVSISAGAAATEGSPVTFTVNLSTAADEAVNLNWTGAGGTATAGTDYTAAGTVTIASTTTSTTFTVATVDDAIAEGDEMFTVTIAGTSLPTGVTLGTATATGTITDDDSITVSVAGDANATEGSPVTFTVNLSTAAAEAVNLSWTGAGGTATAGTDYMASGTVTIDVGATTNTFTVATVDDALVEDDETFIVTLAGTNLPSGVFLGTAMATGTITDSDMATISITNASATEGENIAFTVSLTAAVDEAVNLNWSTADGTATTSDDYTQTNGTVTIPANMATGTFTVATVDDAIVEGDEAFTVTLAASGALPTRVTLGTTTATGTITDDDTATVSVANASAIEGENIIFTVSLTAAADEAVNLNWSTADDTATAGIDYTAVTDGSLTLAAGVTSITFMVTTLNDFETEDDETFTVTLTARGSLPSGVSISAATVTGTIIDNDLAVSALVEPRRTGAASALRRHVNRFESVTKTAVHDRLQGSPTRKLQLTENTAENGEIMVGDKFGESLAGGWVSASYASFDGNASGHQSEFYGGIDYLSDDGNRVIGALLGLEFADFDIGSADYRARYAHVGIYGGAKLAGNLLFDGAISYGSSRPSVDLPGVSANYSARRFMVHGALTGSFDLPDNSVTLLPRVGLIYARERLSGFTDNIGGEADREVMEMWRLDVGPGIRWGFDGGELTGGLKLHWDFMGLEDEIDKRFSGAGDLRLRFNLTPNINIAFFGDIDGIGISSDFITYGGGVKLQVKFCGC